MKFPFAPSVTPKLIAFLKKNSLSMHDFEILYQIGKCCHMSETFLIKRCVSSFRDTYDEPVSDIYIQKSLKALMERRLLQKIDSKALEAIVSAMPKNDVTPKPVDGFPGIGDIDFTQEGAHLYLEMRHRVFHPKETDYWCAVLLGEQEGHIQILATTKSAANGFLHDTMPPGSIVKRSKFEKVGPWITRWWEIFPNGWRLEVDIERNKSVENEKRKEVIKRRRRPGENPER